MYHLVFIQFVFAKLCFLKFSIWISNISSTEVGSGIRWRPFVKCLNKQEIKFSLINKADMKKLGSQKHSLPTSLQKGLFGLFNIEYSATESWPNFSHCSYLCFLLLAFMQFLSFCKSWYNWIINCGDYHNFSGVVIILLPLGAIQKPRRRKIGIFWPPLPPRRHFLYKWT